MLALEMAVVYSMSSAATANERRKGYLARVPSAASCRSVLANSDTMPDHPPTRVHVVETGAGTTSATTMPPPASEQLLDAPIAGTSRAALDIPPDFDDLLDAVLAARHEALPVDVQKWAAGMAATLTKHVD